MRGFKKFVGALIVVVGTFCIVLGGLGIWGLVFAWSGRQLGYPLTWVQGVAVAAAIFAAWELTQWPARLRK